MAIKLSLITKSSISAFLAWLENEWALFDGERSLDAAIVPSFEAMRTYRRSAGDKLTYPFGLTKVATIQPHGDKAPYNKRHMSVETGRDQRDATVKIENLIPVQVGMGVHFRTDNWDDILTYSSMLMLNAPGPPLVISNEDTGFQFECRVNIDPQIDIPDITSAEDGKYYVLEQTFILNTYIGVVRKQGLIKNIDISFKSAISPLNVNLSQSIADGEVQELVSRTLDYKDLFNTKHPNFDPSTLTASA